MSTRPAVLGLTALALASAASAQDWFDAARHFPVVDRGVIRQVADMDADGDQDLVWIGETTVQVWWNDGTGSFTQGPLHVNGTKLYLPAPTYDFVLYPQAGDVTGDGLPDVVVGTDVPYPHAAIVVFKNLGGGLFDESVTDLPDAPGVSDGFMLATALGNIDGDPALEVATAQDMSNGSLIGDVHARITWWNWHGNRLTPGAPLTTSGPLARVHSLATVDVGDDGVADLIAGGSNGGIASGTVQLLPTVGGAATLGASWGVPSSQTNLATGDIDGDGDLDAVGCGRVTCSDTSFHAFLDQGGAFVRVDSPTTNGEACAWSTRIALGDLDGDGDLDAFENDESARAFFNDGSAHFALAGTQATEPVPAFGFASPGCADLDGDGKDDLVTSRGIVFGRTLPLADPVSPGAPGTFPTAFVAADLEGDGDVDLLAQQGIVGVNNGSGTFTKVVDAWPTFPGLSVSLTGLWAVGDFNGDGLLDQVVARTDGPYFQQVFVGMELLLDAGNGKYVDGGTVIPPTGSFGLLAGEPRRGADVDADGDEDLPLYGGYWRNDGPAVPWTFVAAFPGSEMGDVADFDGDGDADVLTTTVNPGIGNPVAVALMRNDGASVFAAIPLLAPSTSIAPHPRFLDLDDDGDLDVAVAMDDGSAAATLFENQGGGAFGAPVVLDAGGPGATGHVAAADVDADGLTDLLVDRNLTGTFQDGELGVFRRSGPGLVYDSARFWVGKVTTAIADVDEDGDPDAIGLQLRRGRRFEGAEDGIVLQYGPAKAGTGGIKPLLGASGPLRPDSTTAGLHLRRAVGGGQSFVFISGTGPASVGGVIPGGIFLVKPPVTLFGPIPLSGAAGAAGKGGFDVDITPLLPVVAGIAIWHQIVVHDPGAPGGISASNGLVMVYGS